jgi:opacity protein-like surface antigen
MKTLLLSLIAGSLTIPSALAQFNLQESARTGTFEVGGMVQWFSGETVDGRFNGRDGDLELEDLFGGGITFGYHINEHLAVNTDLVFSRAEMNFAAPGVRTLHDDADFFAWTVNLEYYILPTRFTPFLTAGIGFLYMDNWYDDDYWYYCCGAPDREILISETDFLWNVGGGLRWDVTDNVVLKLGYRIYGTELEYADEHMFMHSALLSVLYQFR